MSDDANVVSTMRVSGGERGCAVCACSVCSCVLKCKKKMCMELRERMRDVARVLACACVHISSMPLPLVGPYLPNAVRTYEIT